MYRFVGGLVCWWVGGQVGVWVGGRHAHILMVTSCLREAIAILPLFLPSRNEVNLKITCPDLAFSG